MQTGPGFLGWAHSYDACMAKAVVVAPQQTDFEAAFTAAE